MFIYCWYSYAFPISTGIWFGVINFSVHGVMYAYYAVRASGRRPPKWVAQCVTSIQLSQMFGGKYVSGIIAVLVLHVCRPNQGISVVLEAWGMLLMPKVQPRVLMKHPEGF